jgi:aminoglycoside phosphotransferase (APT) family kinase protein
MARPYDPVVHWAPRQLDDAVDVERARAVWQNALAVGERSRDPVWFHGDLLPGNILVSTGHLVGVIDRSGAGVGDPTCEAMLEWSLPSDARRLFRETIGFDDATWARARGWVVRQSTSLTSKSEGVGSPRGTVTRREPPLCDPC